MGRGQKWSHEVGRDALRITLPEGGVSSRRERSAQSSREGERERSGGGSGEGEVRGWVGRGRYEGMPGARAASCDR